MTVPDSVAGSTSLDRRRTTSTPLSSSPCTAAVRHSLGPALVPCTIVTGVVTASPSNDVPTCQRSSLRVPGGIASPSSSSAPNGASAGFAPFGSTGRSPSAGGPTNSASAGGPIDTASSSAAASFAAASAARRSRSRRSASARASSASRAMRRSSSTCAGGFSAGSGGGSVIGKSCACAATPISAHAAAAQRRARLGAAAAGADAMHFQGLRFGPEAHRTGLLDQHAGHALVAELGRARADVADEERHRVRLARVVARGVRVDRREAVDEAVLEQEVERAIHGRRCRAVALVAQPVEQVVCLDRLLLARDELEHALAQRRELQPARVARLRDLAHVARRLVLVFVFLHLGCGGHVSECSAHKASRSWVRRLRRGGRPVPKTGASTSL